VVVYFRRYLRIYFNLGIRDLGILQTVLLPLPKMPYVIRGGVGMMESEFKKDIRAGSIYDFLKIVENHLNTKTSWGKNQLMQDLRTLALKYLADRDEIKTYFHLAEPTNQDEL
jgi:hypothetical protein